MVIDMNAATTTAQAVASLNINATVTSVLSAFIAVWQVIHHFFPNFLKTNSTPADPNAK